MRFFFYGTLIAGSGNPIVEWLHERLAPGRPGHAIGRLYAVADPQGWYPAFVPDSAGSPVHGMVHETAPGFGDADLVMLDAYEEYRPCAPEPSEFVRQAVAVHMAGVRLDAEAYVWAKPPPDGPIVIPEGDFRAFLAERGETAFGTPTG